MFNNAYVTQSIYQNHRDIIQDSKLKFGNHLKMVTTKIYKIIVLLHKLQNLLPRTALITIYKVFVRFHFEDGDVLYDQAFNLFYHQKLEPTKYSACLTILCNSRFLYREDLSIARLRTTSITTVVQKTSIVLQNL